MNNNMKFDLEKRIDEMSELLHNKQYEAVIELSASIENVVLTAKDLFIPVEYYRLLSRAAFYMEDFQQAYTAYMEYHQAHQRFIENQYRNDENSLFNLEKLNLIASVGKQFTIQSSIKDLLFHIHESVEHLVPATTIGIGEIKGDRLDFTMYRSYGNHYTTFNLDINDPHSFSTWVIRNKEDIYMNDTENEYRNYISDYKSVDKDQNLAETIHSCIFAPLVVNDEVIGVFSIQSYGKGAYPKEAYTIFKILNSYVSIAIYNLHQTRRLKEMALQDTLTGLYNQRGFMDVFNQFSNDKNTTTSMALFVIDLALLQTVNNEYGHLAGDYILETVSETLKEYTDETHYFARINGEEFNCLLINQSYNNTMAFANTLLNHLKSLDIRYHNTRISIEASIGLCYVDNPENYSYNDLFRYADINLADAKDKKDIKLVGSELNHYFFT